MKTAARNRKAFTLIELLVVIAIIALLLSIILPSLNRAKGVAQNMICKTNMRALTLAIVLYAGDTNGDLPCSDDGGPGAWWGGTGDYPNGRTNSEYAMNGTLWPYLKTTKVYACPVDKRTHGNPGARSFSLNGGIGKGGQSWAPICEKMGQIKHPSEKYTFVEEYQSTGNSWILPIPTALGGFGDNGDVWGDPLSMYHYNHNSNFGFADGSAGMRVWEDPRTRQMHDERAALGQGWNGYVSPGNEDLYWMQKHYPVKDR